MAKNVTFLRTTASVFFLLALLADYLQPPAFRTVCKGKGLAGSTPRNF